jgi:glycosyltransferase involved in cell wall biosynthesis
MGVSDEKAVFRELRLYPDNSEYPEGEIDYRTVYAHERHNASCLQYRLRRFKPDIVYVWNMSDLSKSLLFQMQELSLRVVYDLHADWLLAEKFNCDPWHHWWCMSERLRTRLSRARMQITGRRRRVLRTLPVGEAGGLRLNGSYVVSEWLRERLVEAGFSEVGKLPLIYPAVDLKKLSLKSSYGRRLQFAWAGRLDDTKGSDLAVDAVGILKERGIEVALDIFAMGGPLERKAQRARIEAAGLIDQVTMRGIRPGEMMQHYPHYDALLYTHLRGEPFSMTVLEAMLSKLPCIVADIGGNRELLQHGKDAIFFEPENADSLADAIEQFSLLDDHGRSLAEHSIDQLHQERSIDCFCQELESLLEVDPELCG